MNEWHIIHICIHLIHLQWHLMAICKALTLDKKCILPENVTMSRIILIFKIEVMSAMHVSERVVTIEAGIENEWINNTFWPIRLENLTVLFYNYILGFWYPAEYHYMAKSADLKEPLPLWAWLYFLIRRLARPAERARCMKCLAHTLTRTVMLLLTVLLKLPL